ncbi:MAG: lipoprotein NlpI [Planctomycetes bacterium ADurb.Bin401]|nr:MAG: lipoprotein NlpI [Planctomycetes bacterium ADurb.Bin401]
MPKKTYGYSNFWISICLAAAVLAIYWPVYKFDFIRHYDDGAYVVNNRHIQTGVNFKTFAWAFTSGRASNWHPLTWISHTIDYQLFGKWPGGHHLVNVLFHFANTILLFYLLKKTTSTLWPSFFVAAAFAVHPLHVESVAFIAERKDVLSTLFWFLTMIAYVNYTDMIKIKKNAEIVIARQLTPAQAGEAISNLKWYAFSLAFFIFGLMSKPMLVTVPFVLLLIDYWPLERKYSKKLIFEKIPFFILAAASCVITYMVQQHGGAMETGESFGLGVKISNAAFSYTTYILKMFYPAGLAVLYPHPGNINILKAVLSIILLMMISVLLIYFSRKHKFFGAGWLWFLGTLVPVIGIVQVGPQAMADRYTYVPYVGLFIILAFSAKEFLSKQNRICVSIILLVIWGFIASAQVSCWQNDETLYVNTLRNTENNHIILGNYVNYLIDNNRIDEAIAKSQELLKIKPDSYQAYCNYGAVLLQTGKIDEAAKQFKLALKYKPDLAQAYFNLALVSRHKGRLEEAVQYYNDAIRAKPDYIDAYICLGLALNEMNKKDDAIKIFRTGLQIAPDNSILNKELKAALQKHETK